MTSLSRRLDLVAGAGRRARLGLLSVWIAAGVPLAAQPLHWGAIGPRGGSISSLATVVGGGGVVWATASGLGSWRSIDGGASWEPASLAQPQSYSAVATDPANPLVVYAYGGSSLAKTIDGGATWKVINSTAAGAFAVAPSAPGTLYVASQGSIGQFAVVSRSDDGGATWRPLASLPPLVEGIYELDVDPADPNSVYAQGFAFHLDTSPAFLHSADGGQSWNAGFVWQAGYLSSLQIDPRAAGSLYGVGQQGPVRSHDGGLTWELANAGLPAGSVSLALALDRASGALYLATGLQQDFVTLGQIWKSVDGGTTWAKLVERSGALYPLALDGALPGKVYAGTEDEGLLASADAGQHWQVAGAGFVPPTVFDLAADSRPAGAVYATVRAQSGSLSVPSPVAELASSQDGGATWTRWVPRDQDGATVFLGALIVDPFAAGSLYTNSYSLLHSADGGRTWRSTGKFLAGFAGASSVVVDSLHAGVLFAAGPWSQGGSAVLRSADGGQSWITAFNVPGFGPFVNTLLMDPTPPEAIFAGGGDGFWRSVDGGQTWISLGLGLPFNGQVIVRMQTDASHNLYAELFPSGPGLHTLYRSTDRGATWNAIDAGLPAGIQVNDLLADPRGTALYAGTTNGVYVTMDGGAHWTAENDGLASTYIYRLANSLGHSGLIYAATQGGLVVSPPPAKTCIASDEVLCLAGGRFAARVTWSLADGTGGAAHTAALTDGSGGFWFFSPESLELTVKMIDGRALNGHFWLYGGALTDVGYTLTVTEVATGLQRTYSNSPGRLASFADTEAFAVSAASRAGASFESSSPARVSAGLAAAPAGALCIPAADTLCAADSRFAVRVTWSLPGVANQSAGAVPLFGSTGAFWFFTPQIPELTVKVLDGRTLNGHFWVFLGGLSGVAYTATVTDTATGASKQYVHPAGTVGSVADTSF
jgi:photosystem II stability/assembly factor-like uncharacterized protein